MSDKQRESDLDETFESADAPELNNVGETNERLVEAEIGTETEAQAETPALPRVLRWLLLVDARTSVIVSAVAVVAVIALVFGVAHTKNDSAAARQGEPVGVLSARVSAPPSSGVSFADSLISTGFSAPEDPAGIVVSGASVTNDKIVPLRHATDAIEDAGYKVGYVLLDVNTGATISYNADTAFYSASSLKGPYVAALARYGLGDGIESLSGLVSATIEQSDNVDYDILRRSNGNDVMRQLIDEAGAENLPVTAATSDIDSAMQTLSVASIADNNYEFVTPNQLLSMWALCGQYLASNEPGAAYLASEFAIPETSAIRYVGRAFGGTWSKAGWYPGEGGSLSTTVDAGVVREETGDVVLVVMTNKGSDFSVIDSIALELLELHECMVS